MLAPGSAVGLWIAGLLGRRWRDAVRVSHRPIGDAATLSPLCWNGGFNPSRMDCRWRVVPETVAGGDGRWPSPTAVRSSVRGVRPGREFARSARCPLLRPVGLFPGSSL